MNIFYKIWINFTNLEIIIFIRFNRIYTINILNMKKIKRGIGVGIGREIKRGIETGTEVKI